MAAGCLPAAFGGEGFAGVRLWIFFEFIGFLQGGKTSEAALWPSPFAKASEDILLVYTRQGLATAKDGAAERI